MTIHKSVLLNEAISALNIFDGGTYIDATFGAGGYTKEILLRANSTVIAFDRDPTVIPIASAIKQQFGEKFHFFSEKFSEIANLVQSANGIVADFGISSMHVDNADRGFSFQKNAKLNMQMGKCEISAFDVVNHFEESKIADIIFRYSNERLAKKIAGMIYSARKKQPIETTLELAQLIYEAYNKPQHYKIHPATKTFQAIRIFVNNELEEIELLLASSTQILQKNGVLACVSFHELEDRLVKNFFEENSEKKVKMNKYSQEIQAQSQKPFEIITKKPIEPTDAEVRENPRSRSAKLRVGIRV